MTSRRVVQLYIRMQSHSGLLKSDSHLGITYDRNLIICHILCLLFISQGNEWKMNSSQRNLSSMDMINQ